MSWCHKALGPHPVETDTEFLNRRGGGTVKLQGQHAMTQGTLLLTVPQTTEWRVFA